MSIFAGIAGTAAGLLILTRLVDGRTDEVQALEIAQHLKPFVGTQAQARHMNDDEMWQAIGHLKGAWRLFVAAGSIASLAAQVARQHPEAEDAAQWIFLRALSLRLLSIPLLGEALMCRIFPVFPRAIAAGILKLYCDIAAISLAVEAIANPA